MCFSARQRVQSKLRAVRNIYFCGENCSVVPSRTNQSHHKSRPVVVLLAGDLGLDSQPNWSERATGDCVPFPLRAAGRDLHPPPDTNARLSLSLLVTSCFASAFRVYSTDVDSHEDDGRDDESGLSWAQASSCLPYAEDIGRPAPSTRRSDPVPRIAVIETRFHFVRW